MQAKREVSSLEYNIRQTKQAKGINNENDTFMTISRLSPFAMQFINS